jgi:hypothetical protein
MAERNWLIGSAFLAIGILLGHMFTRANTPPAPLTAINASMIPPADSGLQQHAPESADLEIDPSGVAFCQRIAGFGLYETFPKDEFSPDQDVLLYADFANIHSARESDGKFRTVIKSTIEFYRDGEPEELVKRIEFPETVDLCRRQRHDYFHSYQFTIPSRLTAGQHKLKLILQDQLDLRTANCSLPFAVR